MICNYEDSESGNSFPCDNDNESLDDSSLKDLGKTYHYILNQIAINEERIRRVSFGNRILAKLMSLHRDLCFMLNKPPSIMNYNINNEYNGNVNFNNSNNYSYLNRSIAHSNMNQYK